MVAQLLHQAKLSLVFDRLMRRTVLAHAERVVRPDVLDRQTLQSSQTQYGLHVIGEDEESPASRNHASVKRHSVHDAGHRELGHARLQEAAGEIALAHRMGLLQETVGLVRVAQVGRSDDHVLHMLGQIREHGGRSGARSHVVAAIDLRVVDRRRLARQEQVELGGLLLIGSAPDRLFLAAQRVPFFQFLAATRIQFLHVVENHERILRIAAQRGHRLGNVAARGRQRLSMRGNLVREILALLADGALAHQRMADDQRRLFGLRHRAGESLTDFGGIVAVDTDDAPAPSLVLGHDILGRNLLDLGRKLDIVRVVEHDQVAQPEMPGDAADALRNLFLNTAVGDERVGLVRHPVAEASYEKTLGDRRTQSHRMALPQRARGILDSAVEIDLGMTRRRAAPLPERRQLVHIEIAGQSQYGIEHRRHMAGIEEEAVAERIARVVGIVPQELGVENVHEIGSAHRSAGMARLGFLHHRRCENPDIVRSLCC